MTIRIDAIIESKLTKAFAVAGAAPVVIGTANVLLGGFSSAFNAMASVSGTGGAVALTAGAVTGIAVGVTLANKAFNRGFFGKELAAGLLFFFVGMPVSMGIGGFLGATGASVIAGKVAHVSAPSSAPVPQPENK